MDEVYPAFWTGGKRVGGGRKRERERLGEKRSALTCSLALSLTHSLTYSRQGCLRWHQDVSIRYVGVYHSPRHSARARGLEVGGGGSE